MNVDTEVFIVILSSMHVDINADFLVLSGELEKF